jgi:hypothetical protein
MLERLLFLHLQAKFCFFFSSKSNFCSALARALHVSQRHHLKFADKPNFSSPVIGDGGSMLHDDQISIDYSDSESESCFEAEVMEEEIPDELPLPSWPKLDSTS